MALKSARWRWNWPGECLKGPLPLEAALNYAKQIAEALEAAHEKAIVHRDLKPGNIMVTPVGVVKVLDFGLAAVALDSASKASDPLTRTMPATQAGAIMGTAAYMSPEQASGKPVDKRSDIWSFGVVLWEMLTGKRLFHGETNSQELVEVLTSQIDFHKLPQETPAQIRNLLRRCLACDVKTRLRDIGEARVVIGEYLAHPSSGNEVPRQAEGRPNWPWMAVAGILALALIVAGVLLYQATRPEPLRPLVRLNAEIGRDSPMAIPAGGTIALSPNGARLAFTLRGGDGKVRLHTRLLDQNQITPLAGTENAEFPFFSPNGEWIGFFADGKLKKIAVEGGAAVKLCDAPVNRGASWGDDDNIIVALYATGVLSRVSSGGGTPVPVTKLNPGEITHRWPQVLPGSQAVLVTVSGHQGNYDDANIDVVSLKTGERKTVQRGGFSPHYLVTSTGTRSNETGYLIYLQQSTLFAVPFHAGRLALTGAPAPILEDVSSTSGVGGVFAFAGMPSGSGTFVYLPGKGRGGWPISWLDRKGKTQPLYAPPGFYFTPRFSPDGNRLAFSISSGQGDNIWVKDLDRDTQSPLSFLPGLNRLPVWTPDGKNIVFQSTNQPSPGMYWIRSDGSGGAQRLTDGKLEELPHSFSPDGKLLAFSQHGIGGSFDIFTVAIESDPARGTNGVRLGKAELFLGTPFNEIYPAFSPDGRWLAYVSNESETSEVYVRPFPGPGGRWQISTGGGIFPLWSRDGRELLFQSPDLRVMASSCTAKGDLLVAGKPRVWSETRLLSIGGFSNYDMAPDGKRLAAILSNDEASGQKPAHLTFLLNFFDELRRKVPAGK